MNYFGIIVGAWPVWVRCMLYCYWPVSKTWRYDVYTELMCTNYFLRYFWRTLFLKIFVWLGIFVVIC